MRESPLTNFLNLKRGKKITETDHNKLELFLNIEAPTIKRIREVPFNFKSEHNQKVFNEISSNSGKLRNSFKFNQNLQQQARIFEKTLNNVFFQSFQKIRGKKRKVENPEIDGLIKKRKKLKQEVKNPLNRRAQNYLEIVEKTIANLVLCQK